MNIQITAEDIERANRLMQSPFDSDKVWYTVHPTPVVNDDGLFNHRGEYILCHGCQPDTVSGEATWSHGHIVVEGSNGGMRCQPLTDDSVGRLARDLRYATPDSAAIRIVQDADARVGVAVICSAGPRSVQLPLSVTATAADALASQNADALDSLVARNALFEDVGDS